MSGYTKTPDFLIDELMSSLTGAELKICMAILRKTVGWNKPSDEISISQFMDITGLSNRSVISTITELLSRKIISRQPSGHSFSYSLTAQEGDQGKKFTSEKSSQVTSEKSSQVPVKKVHRLPPKSSEKSSHTIDSNIKTTINRDVVVVSNDKSFSEITSLYENEIGLLTATISDELQHLMDEAPASYIVDAIKLAATANKRNLRYVKGIIKNWQANGKQDTRKSTQSNTMTVDAIIERQQNELPDYMK